MDADQDKASSQQLSMSKPLSGPSASIRQIRENPRPIRRPYRPSLPATSNQHPTTDNCRLSPPLSPSATPKPSRETNFRPLSPKTHQATQRPTRQKSALQEGQKNGDADERGLSEFPRIKNQLSAQPLGLSNSSHIQSASIRPIHENLRPIRRPAPAKPFCRPTSHPRQNSTSPPWPPTSDLSHPS